jgi:hypothetical protein
MRISPTKTPRSDGEYYDYFAQEGGYDRPQPGHKLPQSGQELPNPSPTLITASCAINPGKNCPYAQTSQENP